MEPPACLRLAPTTTREASPLPLWADAILSAWRMQSFVCGGRCLNGVSVAQHIGPFRCNQCLRARWAALCSKALLEEARVPLSLVKERLQTILLKRSSVDVRAAPRLLYVARCMLWDSSERPYHLSKCGPILRLPIVCTRYADADVTCSCDEVHVGRSWALRYRTARDEMARTMAESLRFEGQLIGSTDCAARAIGDHYRCG